jgi:hypothetical protein
MTFVWQHPTCIVTAVTILMSRLLVLYVQTTSHNFCYFFLRNDNSRNTAGQHCEFWTNNKAKWHSEEWHMYGSYGRLQGLETLNGTFRITMQQRTMDGGFSVLLKCKQQIIYNKEYILNNVLTLHTKNTKNSVRHSKKCHFNLCHRRLFMIHFHTFFLPLAFIH